MYQIRPTKDIEAVKELHTKLFGTKCSLDGTDHWLVWEQGKSYPVGFCSGRKSSVKGWYFLARAGVLREARGKNLQQRLLRIRERRARTLGLVGCLTYVANWNSPSLVNLLKLRYTVYDPCIRVNRKWKKEKRDGYLYLSRRLVKPKKKGTGKPSRRPVSS
jgi:GNAT superfamily N-acetyltransferase